MGSPFAPNEVPAPVCAAALSGSLTESVKLCKHDTPLLFAPSGANHEQGLGQARPNKITWKTRKSLRSEVPDGQEIFKN